MSKKWDQIDLFPSTSSSAGFPAKTSALPGHAEDSQASAAGCGSTSCASSKSCDRPASSSRTLADSLGGAWTRWRPGSTGLATRWRSPESPPLTSGHHIAGSGTSSWAWPTPTCGDAEASGSRSLPTSKAHAGTSLTDAIRPDRSKAGDWPTPLASDWKSQSPATMATNARPLRERIDGRLSPDWVEALMGFPPGWSDLGPEGLGRLRAERRNTRGSPRGRSADRETPREGGK